MKVIYQKIEYFNDDIQYLKKNKKDFLVHKTQYTRKVVENDLHTIYNDTGENDVNTLKYINKIKNEVKKSDFCNGLKTVDTDNINWCYLDIDSLNNQRIYKIDIVGAYWNTAINLGIISKEFAQSFYNDCVNDFDSLDFKKEYKKRRLKVLGSLATKKEILTYTRGRLTGKPEIKCNEYTRNIYLYICEQVDYFMQKIKRNNKDIFFYYWDCFFVIGDNNLEKIFKDIESFGYEYTIESAVCTVFPLSETRLCIHTTVDDKQEKKIYFYNKFNNSFETKKI